MTIGLTGIDALEAEMRDRLAAKNGEIERLRKALEDETSEHSKLKEDVAALIEEAREEERQEAAMLWPDWADKMLKILRGFGVPCDDEEGVDLPQELADWLEVYGQDVRREAEKRGNTASPSAETQGD